MVQTASRKVLNKRVEPWFLTLPEECLSPIFAASRCGPRWKKPNGLDLNLKSMAAELDWINPR